MEEVTETVDGGGFIPEVPPEMLSQVFKNLINLDDLLNCRLVCKAWNDVILDLVKKMKFTQGLENNVIQEYVAFAKETGATKVLPYRIYITYHQNQVDWTSIAEDVFSLIDLVGIASITGLRVHLLEETRGMAFLSILEKLAPYLDSFGLFCDVTPGFYPNEIVAALRQSPNLTFPCMAKMKFKSTPMVGVRDIARIECEWELYCILIGRSLSLRELVFHGELSFRNIEIIIPLQQLKHLTLRDLNNPAPLSKAIRACPSVPVLESFDHDFGTGHDTSLHDTKFQRDVPDMICFMQGVSPNLKSLTYYFSGKYNPSEGGHINVIPFSRMPKLTYLYIQIVPGRDTMQLPFDMDASRWNFTPAALPALKTIIIPFGLTWSNTAKDPFEFLSVTAVRINFPNDVLEDDDYEGRNCPALQPDSVKSFITHIFQVFPKITSLVVWGNQHAQREDNAVFMKRVLSEVISNPGAAMLQVLEIRGYNEDYLGQILYGLDHPLKITVTIDNLLGNVNSERAEFAFRFLVAGMGIGLTDLRIKSTSREQSYSFIGETQGCQEHHLQNVRKLQLYQFCRREPFDLDFNMNKGNFQKILHLEHFARYMPNICGLQLSESMLSGSDGAEALQRAQEIEGRYCNWRVTIEYEC